MLVCLDYEHALECSKLVDFIEALSRDQREQMFNRALRYRQRFVPLFRDWKTSASPPAIPAACVAASWFPKHWLTASRSQRRKVEEQTEPLYSGRSLPVWKFPMDSEEAEMLSCNAKADERTTLHVIAVDRTETKSALVKRFKAWIDEQKNIEGSGSRKGKINVPAMLNDLACYRLSKLDVAPRLDFMGEAGFSRSEARRSQAKARAAKRLHKLGYI